MARNLPADWETESLKQTSKPILAVDLVFNGSVVRLWNGINDIQISGNTYYGNGWLKEISTPEESATEEYDDRIVIMLQGQSQDVLSLVTLESRINDTCIVHVAYEKDDGTITGTYELFKGYFSHSEIIDDPQTCTVQLFYYPDVHSSDKIEEYTYSNETQKYFYPDDRGFEYVDSLADLELWWGNDRAQVEQIKAQKEEEKKAKQKKKEKRRHKRNRRKNRVL